MKKQIQERAIHLNEFFDRKVNIRLGQFDCAVKQAGLDKVK